MLTRGAKMLTLSEIQERLKDRNLAAVSRASKVGHAQLWRIATGRAKLVKPEVLERISAYLEGKQA